MPQIQRHGSQCENKGTDQERTRRPIDPICRNSKKHWELFWEERPAAVTIQQSIRKRSSQHHVFFRPAMDFATMRAGELLRFHFCRRPALFFHGASGIGQLGRGGTTYEQTFQAGTDFRFLPARGFEEKS